MIIKPLIQLRQTVETTLRGMTNISKPFVTFFIETMEMYLSVNKKINFTQMARFGRSCENRFRDDVRLRYIYQIEFCYRDAKQMTGLTHYQARNREALAFAFNMSLASVNMARAIAAMNGINLSVGSIKTLMHNASMLKRFR